MRLTCNKKAYKEFQEECNKCSMKTECVDNGKSVFIGIIERSPVNVTINFGNTDIDGKADAELISKRITEVLKNEITTSLGRW